MQPQASACGGVLGPGPASKRLPISACFGAIVLDKGFPTLNLQAGSLRIVVRDPLAQEN